LRIKYKRWLTYFSFHQPNNKPPYNNIQQSTRKIIGGENASKKGEKRREF
jgi:hypothetical protein